MGGEEGVAGGAALVGARAFGGVLAFLDLFLLVFFGKLKKGLDPSGPGSSAARTSRMNMNIHCFPFARGHRGGSKVMAQHMRCVWKLGWKSTQWILLLSSFWAARIFAMRWSLLRNQWHLNMFRTWKIEGPSFMDFKGTVGTTPAAVGGRRAFTAFLGEGGRALRVRWRFYMGVKIDMMVVWVQEGLSYVVIAMSYVKFWEEGFAL
jgi:hypothetical protein